MKKFGDRQSVYDGLATMTRGGLTKDDLIVSKTGRIVSKKKSEAAKNAYQKFGFKKRKKEETKPVEPEPEPKKKKRRRRKKKEE